MLNMILKPTPEIPEQTQ